MKRPGRVGPAGVFLLLPLLVLLSGCGHTRSNRGASASEHIAGALAPKTGTAALNQAQVQAIVMNFADVLVMSTWQTLDEIRRSATEPKIRANAQYLKLFTTSNAMSIAAGRNSAVNLLDMLVFVSIGRHVVEEYWAPKVLGSHGEPLAKTYRKLEQEIWQKSGRVLSEEQQKSLRDLIKQWIAANPEQYYTAAIRLSDFAETQGASPASQMEVGNLLADVEKAVAVAEEGMLLSERVMFYAERLPRIMTMQTELLLDQIASAPTVEQLRANLDKLTEGSERLSLTAADLPKYVTQERQAAIDQAFDRLGAERKLVMKDLESQESRLRGVLEEVRGLLDRATPLTDKLDATVHSAETFYRLVDSTPSNLPQYKDLLEKSLVAMDKLESLLAEVKPLYAASTEDARAMNDLKSQESRLRDVLEEVRGLLDRAIPLTDKVNTTVHSADTLYRLMDSTPSNLPQYDHLLEKSLVAMDKLECILTEVTPLYAGVAKDTDVRTDPLFGKTLGLADHLFWRVMLLIGFFLVGLLAVLLLYRYLSLKMSGPVTREATS